jgi:hypothetical protein
MNATVFLYAQKCKNSSKKIFRFFCNFEMEGSFGIANFRKSAKIFQIENNYKIIICAALTGTSKIII